MLTWDGRAAEPRDVSSDSPGKDAKIMSSLWGMVAARRVALIATAIGMWLATTSGARAQSYGIELHNKLMPASGGMGGASLARPQDHLSAINGNPATLTDFPGTHFTFGGAWAEPTYNITQLEPLPLVGVDPYSGKSNQPGSSIANIGVAQELSVAGVPVVLGLGFITSAGLGTSFRQVPESNGTSSQYANLDLVSALGVPVTDRLSAGGAITVGTGFLDGPFTDLGGMTTAYGLRGTLGVAYDLLPQTTIGAYWQTKKHFHFDDAAVVGGNGFDVSFDHPENVGLGVADQSLMDGRVLVAMDVLYKQYSNADFLQSIYDNQWVYQFGVQYQASQRVKLRWGYSYNTNPMRGPALTEVGGVPLPDGVPAFRYIQGQFAAIGQHHITCGVGISNILPCVDSDFLAGGMFKETEQFATTIASVESYWVGTYLTWRFGGK
jgi:long-chain fatty acid transport protein